MHWHGHCVAISQTYWSWSVWTELSTLSTTRLRSRWMTFETFQFATANLRLRSGWCKLRPSKKNKYIHKILISINSNNNFPKLAKMSLINWSSFNHFTRNEWLEGQKFWLVFKVCNFHGLVKFTLSPFIIDEKFVLWRVMFVSRIKPSMMKYTYTYLKNHFY